MDSMESTADELPRLTPELVRASDTQLRVRGVDAPGLRLLDLPEKAVQFGTGMLLRGLVEDFIDLANRKGIFGGRIVAVGAQGVGRDREINEQGGLYTLLVLGAGMGAVRTAQGAAGLAASHAAASAIEAPEPNLPPPAPEEAHERRIIASLSRAICANDHWDDVLAVARDPRIEVVFSNMAEVRIALDEHDRPELSPPHSFPGQLTRFLLERARAFDYAPSSAPVVIPCELVEANGDYLRSIVLELARRWELEPEFQAWVEQWVPFCNTLVDRIVASGSPSEEEQAEIADALGYVDQVVTTCEPYRLLVIEAGLDLWPRLRFVGADPGIVLAEDVRPFRERKVRILNGTHTIAASAGLLCGCATVLDAMRHPVVGPFVRRAIFDEILPTLDALGAEQFAWDVLERLSNPYIRHPLIDITFQATTKMRVRVIPSIRRFAERKGRPPASLAYGFAAYLRFMRGDYHAARVSAGLPVPADDQGERVRAAWATYGDERIPELVTALCSDEALWGADLRRVLGFAPVVTEALEQMLRDGVPAALEAHLASAAADDDSSPSGPTSDMLYDRD